MPMLTNGASRSSVPTQRRWRRLSVGWGRGRTLVAAGVLALAAAGCADTSGDAGTANGSAAESFPTRPITMIVPLPAGSAPDAAFRKLASIAEQDLEQPIVIVNRPGGGGTVGLSEVADAEPDGYTVGVAGRDQVTLLPQLQESSFRGLEDITPVAQVFRGALAIFVKTDSGIETIDDLAEKARQAPGQVSIGVNSAHDITDLTAQLFAIEVGAQMPTVPMGGGKQVLGVLNDTVAAGVASPLVVQPYVESGKMRILGIASEEVPPGFEAQTLTDLGYDVNQTPYNYIVGPAGLDPEVTQRLAEIFEGPVKSQEFEEFAAAGGVIAEYLGPEELRSKLEADQQEAGKRIEQLGWAK